MIKIIYGIVLSSVLSFSVQVLASELLVLSGKNSKNSKKWQEEVFQEYIQTNKGEKLPVKIVTFQGDNFPHWIVKAMEEGRIGEILGTPTFIIWDELNKKEVGRVEGYTQKSRFYSQLNSAILMVDQGRHPGRREGSGGHREEGSGGNQQKEGSGTMSQDIMDHIYKTPEEAQRASEALGFKGEIHKHETPEGAIYMPGSSM